MTTHCMIDIETWGKKPNATILSIGAVKFDPLDPDGPFDNFHVAIDPSAFRSQIEFEIDPDTVMWWMQSSNDLARNHWLASKKLDLPSALVGFTLWYGNESLPTWGNGAAFDNVIMLHNLALCGNARPWSYKDDRCYRTLRAEWPNVKGPTHAELSKVMDLRALPGGDVPHTALFDAQWQAIHLRRIFRHRDEIERAFTDHARPGPAIEQLGLGLHPRLPPELDLKAVVEQFGLQPALDLKPQPLRYGTSLDGFRAAVEHEDAITGQVTMPYPSDIDPHPAPRTGDMQDMVDRVVDGQMGEAD